MSPDSGAGVPGWFVALFILIALLAIGGFVWRVAVARKIAEGSGLDPNKAAAVTVLSRDGVGATYLAAALAAHRTPHGPDVTKSAEQRLLELQALRDKHLVSDEEYELQRQKIVGSI